MKFILSLVVACSMAFAETLISDEQKTYKKVGNVELQLHIFNPEGHKASDRKPAIVFFFGEPGCKSL